MPTEPSPVSLSEIVRRAAEVVDPDDTDGVVGEFERAFEDADEPVTALDDVENRVATVLQNLDPAVASGTLSMLGALTTYLAYRRDELDADDGTLIRLAARAEWSGAPPEAVVEWLEAPGVGLRTPTPRTPCAGRPPAAPWTAGAAAERESRPARARVLDAGPGAGRRVRDGSAGRVVSSRRVRAAGRSHRTAWVLL